MRAMALRPILIIPDKRLRTRSAPVEKIDAEIRKLVDDMFETMYDAPGIGLAAIQVGVAEARRDHGPRQEGRAAKQPQVFINPEIVWSSEETSTYEEGCLSIPEIYEDVERPAQREGEVPRSRRQAARGRGRRPLATCLQHEIDHLNGVLFIDHISKLKRDRIVKKFTKAAKNARPSRSA